MEITRVSPDGKQLKGTFNARVSHLDACTLLREEIRQRSPEWLI
jgi:hypothetical protein